MLVVLLWSYFFHEIYTKNNHTVNRTVTSTKKKNDTNAVITYIKDLLIININNIYNVSKTNSNY